MLFGITGMILSIGIIHAVVRRMNVVAAGLQNR
jgi:hypothetical protein